MDPNWDKRCEEEGLRQCSSEAAERSSFVCTPGQGKGKPDAMCKDKAVLLKNMLGCGHSKCQYPNLTTDCFDPNFLRKFTSLSDPDRESGLGTSHLATAILVLFAGSIWLGICNPKVMLRDISVAQRWKADHHQTAWGIAVLAACVAVRGCGQLKRWVLQTEVVKSVLRRLSRAKVAELAYIPRPVLSMGLMTDANPELPKLDSAGFGVSAVHGRSNVLDCCLRTSEVPIPWWIVQDYWLQLVQDGCDIDAAVFITTKGKCLCAPLHSPWVIRLQKRLDATFAKRAM
ncbi:C-C motif chemokine 19 [Lonchura striata]|uniref:C-C motif chemokine 19 n=1 Tax=Lonchura striata TaxID=40157 RepID=A0A218UZ18_9PASE|nr:C-C motif chemokine 19 [Lonchura striata domestica]